MESLSGSAILISLLILGIIMIAVMISESSHSSKEEIKKDPYISRLDPVTKKPILVCPRCGCQDIGITKRGFSLTTGFLFSGQMYHVCNNCLHKFK